MSETKEQVKHTPGPWKIAEEDVTANLNGWRRNFILVHSTVYNHGQTALVPNGMDERGEANASLIAAAPELLEALRRCVALMKNGFIPPENLGKDAEEIVSGDYANGWDAACEEFRNSRTAEIAQAAIAKAEAR